jgi:putative ABC transport system ATP-binding protein
VIRVEHVSKVYGRGAEAVSALRDVSLEVGRGEVLALVGPSGSGKTSLLNILGCLDRPSSGTVRLDGREPFALGDAELAHLRATVLGFVFQALNLFELLTARENVEYPLHLVRTPRAERRRRAEEALGWVALGEQGDRRPHQLSGGEKQRVAIARALVHRPKLVLADEPTANLDSETGDRIVSLLVELNRRLGVTLVLATHDAELIARADRVVAIRDGRIAAAADRPPSAGSAPGRSS